MVSVHTIQCSSVLHSFAMNATGIILIFLTTFLHTALNTESGGKCTTPNGETALCISINSCQSISGAVQSGNPIALAFAKKSECGFDHEPLVCCGTTGLPIEKPPQVNVLPDKTVCGLEKEDDRVFGGETTEIGEFPWMVLLGYESTETDGIEFKCGGTLINNRYVLTAAHCLTAYRKRSEVNLTTVRLGEWKISTKEDCTEELINLECSDPVVDVRIEKQIPHLGYSRKTGNNDIALVKLEKNVPYTDYIRPICIPESNAKNVDIGTLLVVSGWGAIENGSFSDVKLKLEVPVVPNTNCADKVKFNGEITDNQICAGGQKGKDACKGDSGGPLMGTYGDRKLSKNQWYQEGVIAWGIGCGRKEFPGIYTRVSKYVDWIMSNIS